MLDDITKIYLNNLFIILQLTNATNICMPDIIWAKS